MAAKEKREAVPLPHISCHHLRHTFCTRLCEADVHIKVIQNIMGHKDIHTTLDIYSEVTEWKKKTSINEAFMNMKSETFTEKRKQQNHFLSCLMAVGAFYGAVPLHIIAARTSYFSPS